jgi:pilus assembly protein CpaC
LLLGLLAGPLLAQVPLPPTPVRTPPVPSAERDTAAGSDAAAPAWDRAPSATLANPALVFKVQSANDRLEMTVKDSRVLTMDQKIPQAEVANPEILELTPLSPNQIQIWAKAPGVTKVNLWDEQKRVSTIVVTVYADVLQIEAALHNLFPTAALKITPVNSAVAIAGHVEDAQQIERIVRVAEEFAPKVLNHMTIGGAQQVQLHVKVYEVSRTKLRQLGFDWAQITGSNAITSGISGLIADNNGSVNPIGAPATNAYAFRTAAASTFAFSVLRGGNGFFGVLNALRQDSLMKICAEPTLAAISGRAASFNSGGEIPVPEPQSLGTISISWKKYGTQLDFVPIVLGNGRVRVEVRSRISELDSTMSFSIDGTEVPAIKERDAETAVEMQAGQTLAIAGLVQTYIEAVNSGLPVVGDIPYLGTLFRNVQENRNEIESLMLVTPELIEPMDSCEVPPCLPGMETTSPSDWDLYMKGFLEVPARCGPCAVCVPASAGGVPAGAMPATAEPIPAPPVAAGPDGQQSQNTPANPNSPSGDAARNRLPGLAGPIGYDVVR